MSKSTSLSARALPRACDPNRTIIFGFSRATIRCAIRSMATLGSAGNACGGVVPRSVIATKQCASSVVDNHSYGEQQEAASEREDPSEHQHAACCLGRV